MHGSVRPPAAIRSETPLSPPSPSASETALRHTQDSAAAAQAIAARDAALWAARRRADSIAADARRLIDSLGTVVPTACSHRDPTSGVLREAISAKGCSWRKPTSQFGHAMNELQPLNSTITATLPAAMRCWPKRSGSLRPHYGAPGPAS